MTRRGRRFHEAKKPTKLDEDFDIILAAQGSSRGFRSISSAAGDGAEFGSVAVAEPRCEADPAVEWNGFGEAQAI